MPGWSSKFRTSCVNQQFRFGKSRVPSTDPRHKIIRKKNVKLLHLFYLHNWYYTWLLFSPPWLSLPNRLRECIPCQTSTLLPLFLVVIKLNIYHDLFIYTAICKNLVIATYHHFDWSLGYITQSLSFLNLNWPSNCATSMT